MFVIEDEAHDERMGAFETLEAAVAELRRLGDLAWDETPNRAPCTAWRTCGRVYELIETDGPGGSGLEISRSLALTVTAVETRWRLNGSS